MLRQSPEEAGRMIRDSRAVSQTHPPKILLPLRRSPFHLTHPPLNRPHSPSPRASGFNQPFCHSTLSGPTHIHTHHIQTDRWARRQVSKTSAYARYIDRERRAKKPTPTYIVIPDDDQYQNVYQVVSARSKDSKLKYPA